MTMSPSERECFTPTWRRSSRKNDVVIPPTNADTDSSKAGKPSPSSSSSDSWWRHRYPCLVCGKPPPKQTDSNSNTPPSSSSCHKRCARCRAAIYCSPECQKQDFTEGKHKANCAALGKLWEEKTRLEGCLWEDKNSQSTNPFDEEVHDYPTVGKFWHDQPKSALEKNTTNYCVVLLQLVQLLGRGESWRVSRIQQPGDNKSASSSGRRRGPGNPLSRELAIDIAYQLLHLDNTDMRVRLLIPSLLLEGEYYQEAYGFLRYWLQVDASLMIMDLALMGGSLNLPLEVSDGNDNGNGNKPISCFFSASENNGIAESPEWIDGEMVYPSIGMVFELAFLKCHLLSSLKRGRFQRHGGTARSSYTPFGEEEKSGSEAVAIAEICTAVGEVELERQVRLLLNLLHKWNPHLLPKLGEPYDFETGAGATQSKKGSVAEEGVTVPATPPAMSTLLNKHPPGFELQYKMGNPGGQSVDEAVAIWQRDMILWHVMDPMTMKFLSGFCSNLEDNLVDTSCLNGNVDPNSGESSKTETIITGSQTVKENVTKRKEAEKLVTKLQKENPEKTMDEIMMHPEMAQLMIKHLHTE